MASRALSAKLTRICSSWWRSASTTIGVLLRSSSSTTCSPSVRSSIDATLRTISVTSTGSGLAMSRRAKVSSWRVRAAPRSAAARTSPRSARMPGRVTAQRDQRGVVQDDAEQVVEVVRDAAGQLAEAVEAVRFLALGLERRVLLGPGVIEFQRQPGVIGITGQLRDVRLRERRSVGQSGDGERAHRPIPGQQRNHGEPTELRSGALRTLGDSCRP